MVGTVDLAEQVVEFFKCRVHGRSPENISVWGQCRALHPPARAISLCVSVLLCLPDQEEERQAYRHKFRRDDGIPDPGDTEEKRQDDDGPCFKDHGTAEGDHSGDESVVECRKEGRCVDAEAHEQERDRV